MAQAATWFTDTLSAIEIPGRWLISDNRDKIKPFQNWNNVIKFLARSQSVNKERTEVVLRTLGPGTYVLKNPIPVCIDRIAGDEVIATFKKANISICGNSATEAIQLLKTEIAELYVILKKEAKLGPEPQRQLLVLEGYIGKKGG